MKEVKGMKKVNMRRFIYFFLFFLLLTLGLFFVQDVLGTKTIKGSLIQSSKDQLTYTDKMLQVGITEASMLGIQFTADNSVRYYQRQKMELTNYDAQMKKVDIFNRLQDQLLASQVADSIGIYWRKDESFISTSPLNLTKDPFKNVTKLGWQTFDGHLYFFSVYPYIRPPKNPTDIQYIVGVKLKTEYLISLLEQSFNRSSSKAFLLVNKDLVISDQVVNKEIVKKVKEKGMHNSEKISEYNYQLDDSDYFVLVKYIEQIDSYLVTYTRTDAFLNPLKQINKFFSVSIIIILIIGLILLIMFYRNFYQNVYLMIQMFHHVEQGDYNSRINEDSNNEFNKLFKSFNHMVQQIQTLFSSLRIETELRRNAEIKQLQAQINPHFLYNSLFFIMSMAKTSPVAVMKMSKHLAEYYRYMTKKDAQDVTLASELELADHYLSIMSLCKDIEYKINLPAEIGGHRIMPLIIQPIVENAIQHGIEERQGAHRVIIDVTPQDSGALITIANDGKGLTSDQLQKLKARVENEEPPKGTNGIGLWNINHRLKNTYGEKSNLQFFANVWSGLTVSFFIDFSLDGGDKNEIINSG
jgi:two-component system, sensor histidine kinase YesM